MARKKIVKHPWSDLTGAARKILRLLCQVHARQHSRRLPEVVEEWMELVQATLLAQPQQLAYLQKHRTLEGFADDAPTQALWARLQAIYPAEAWTLFAQAYACLLDARPDEGDVLGPLYMQAGWANERLGQFFTPLPVARFMAQLHRDELRSVIWGRLRIAYKQSGFGTLIPLPTLEEPDPARLDEAGPVVQGVWRHLAPYYAPVTVYEPSCGSGVMLLAMAEQVPDWVSRLGLVQYLGVDLDLGCVRMCHIQLLLCGLHGAVRHGSALAEPTPEALCFVSPLAYPCVASVAPGPLLPAAPHLLPLPLVPSAPPSSPPDWELLPAR